MSTATIPRILTTTALCLAAVGLSSCQQPLTLEQALICKDTAAVEAALSAGAPCDAEEACNAIWNTNTPEGITEE